MYIFSFSVFVAILCISNGERKINRQQKRLMVHNIKKVHVNFSHTHTHTRTTHEFKGDERKNWKRDDNGHETIVEYPANKRSHKPPN